MAHVAHGVNANYCRPSLRRRIPAAAATTTRNRSTSCRRNRPSKAATAAAVHFTVETHIRSTTCLLTASPIITFDSIILIFCNEAKHILDADVPLCIESSSGDGRQMTYQVSDLDGSGTVWYNLESIAIILSLAEVRRVRRVTMDTSQHKEDGTGTIVFE
jgi:hypothetical protein